MNTTLNIEVTNSETSRAMEIVKKTLEAAHELHRVWPKTVEIRNAIASSNFDICLSTAQKYLRQYRTMINSYSFLTGIHVIDVSLEECKEKSACEWQTVLSFVEMIIYLDTALKYGAKTAIKDAIKRVFQMQ